MNIEESSDEEEEEVPIRDTTKLKTITSKFPLKTQKDIDNHAQEAKELMKKGAEEFQKKLKAKEIERVTKVHEEKKKAEDTSFNKIDTE